MPQRDSEGYLYLSDHTLRKLANAFHAESWNEMSSPSPVQQAIDALPSGVRDAFLWECGSREIDPRGTQAAVLLNKMARDAAAAAMIERAADGAD